MHIIQVCAHVCACGGQMPPLGSTLFLRQDSSLAWIMLVTQAGLSASLRNPPASAPRLWNYTHTQTIMCNFYIGAGI